MKTFHSLLALSQHLMVTAARMVIYEQAGLERCLVLIENTAKKEFGVYQGSQGPFPAWAELSEVTKDERVRLGFSDDEPLKRSGELRDAIEHDVEGLEGVVGVKSGKTHTPYEPGGSEADLGDIMVWHEFGTAHMPPRPVLGPAAFVNKKKIGEILGAAAVSGLIGGSPIHPVLGYDFRT